MFETLDIFQVKRTSVEKRKSDGKLQILKVRRIRRENSKQRVTNKTQVE